MEKYLSNFKNCRQKEPPFCLAACPFSLDVISFIDKVQRGSFNTAYTILRNAVAFPEIACKICHKPCLDSCPLGASAIHLPNIEQAILEFSTKKEPSDYNLPQKKQHIAIIGGGPSGLACALRLSTKKYRVSLFEASNNIGGHLCTHPDFQAFVDDIAFQFQHEKCDFKLGYKVENLSSLIDDINDENLAALYVATGLDAQDFGLLSLNPDEPCQLVDNVGFFAGGSLTGCNSAEALAQGLKMATTIENFIKTGNLLYTSKPLGTSMVLDPSRLVPSPPVSGTGRLGTLTRGETMAEAARCLRCQCDACKVHIDLVAFHNKWPLRLRDEIQATTLPGSSEVKATPAKRLISSTTFDGLCATVCPDAIDLDGLILEARKSMHRQGKLAWVFNEFWLQDMDFSNSHWASIAIKSPQARNIKTTTEYKEQATSSSTNTSNPHSVFFPGCQLGASDPNLVSKTYEALLSIDPNMGLLISCCGVPSEWAGNQEKLNIELDRIKKHWLDLDKPQLILACPTCSEYFSKHLPQVKTTSLYEYLSTHMDTGTFIPSPLDAMWLTDNNPNDHTPVVTAPKGMISCDNVKNINPTTHAPSQIKPLHHAHCATMANKPTYSIFDPCKTIGKDSLRHGVRRLAEYQGLNLSPLPLQEKQPACCSYGGHGSIANPDFAQYVAKKRIAESSHPYICYCINCRDVFRSEGKEAFHILEVLFGTSPNKLPTVTERRENRITLKNYFLKNFTEEEKLLTMNTNSINLEIPLELKEKLSKDRILEWDVVALVEACHKSGETVYNQKKDTYSGYQLIGHMTLWVEYIHKDDRFILVNAYTHRMKIELEGVWNGVKREDNM